MSKIELSLQSPLMVGGKRLKDNVLESLDYIPGHVMRAAFAKHILLRCPLYIPGKPDKDGRYNYIGIKDEDKCSGCHLYDACKNFSNMKFSFFYPKGYEILPLTAKWCKSKKHEHGITDGLTSPWNLRCGKCTENMDKGEGDWGRIGRMESVSGYVAGGKTASVKRAAFSRTSIESFTQTALDGSLYSINAIKPGIVFTGEIQGLEKLNIGVGQSLYVGSYASVGLGRMKVQGIHHREDNKNLLELLEKFNEKRKAELKEPFESKKYIPVLLTSDAKLGFEGEKGFDMPMGSEDYMKEWKYLMLGNEAEGLEIEQVYNEYDIYRGYDTSREWNQWEKEPEIITLKGTTILLSTERLLKSILPILLKIEEEGIGKDRDNGFGQVEICSKFHVNGGSDLNE